MSKLNGTILMVDDDKDVLYTAKLALKQKFQQVVTEQDPNRIPKVLASVKPDVIFLDMNFVQGATSGNEGLFWLREIMKIDPSAHVIMNTAYGDINIAVEAMKLGALDFLEKPWEKEKLMRTAINVFNLKRSRSEAKALKIKQKHLNKEYGKNHIQPIFNSPQMINIMNTVKKVANTDASILILGENGTGKEVIARQIVHHSDRVDEPFIKVDLGALPESLFESELFGHMKGAFTDARADKPGKFELAHGGTIFLDEIGNIPPHLQVKLLSVLQSREVTRIGSNEPKRIDVRLISATNCPLSELTGQAGFREDLLYRINTIEIELPPLRERKADILPLVSYFMNVYGKKYNKNGITPDKIVEQQLKSYHWPGNVRELQHAIERAVILTEGKLIENNIVGLSDASRDMKSVQKMDDIASWEKQAIEKAIKENHGVLSKAADTLGMGRTTLYRKIRKYGL